ncbi:hypothetical protein ABZX38_02050 [Streptomyces longwoodensis]|uniref:hypothetical protein n=1 Tax=Streptomyces longwoodensis TaxID=68231 RepID=UPI0033BC1D2B
MGYGAFDGWEAGQVDDRRLLAELRHQLLDQAAEDACPVETDEERPTSVRPSERHARLKRAREMAEGGKPQSVTVQELLGWWGATGRGLVNELIAAELANHSLIASPGFDKVPLPTAIELVEAAEEDPREAVLTSVPVSASLSAPDEEQSRETGLTVALCRPRSEGWSALYQLPPLRKRSR